MTWLVGGALVAGVGCATEGGPAPRVTALHATSASGETTGLRGVAVDRATYDDLVAMLGGAPDSVALGADAPEGTVRIALAPTSLLVEAYLADLGAPAGESGLTITFDDGTAQPVALLVPAIQKVRDVAVRGSSSSGAHAAGTLEITLEGAARVGGGVSVAAGDVTGDGRESRAASVFVVGTHAPGTTPAQRDAMGDSFVVPTGVSAARFAGSEASLELGDLALANPYLRGRWSAADATMNLVIDVRTDGAGITRFRIPRAEASTASRPAGHVKVFDGQTGISRDGAAERAMFDAGYATFTRDALDKARRDVVDLATTISASLAIAKWTNQRAQTVTDLIAATGAGGSAGYEAMACVAALPAALAAATQLGVDRDDTASAAMTAIEAATTITPKVGLVSGGTLTLQGSGATAPTGDAELACAAIHQLASIPETMSSSEGQAIRALSVELAAFDARYLDVQIGAWIDTMDALAAAPDESAWTAARAKADILIEALGTAATRTEARWTQTAALLGR